MIEYESEQKAQGLCHNLDTVYLDEEQQPAIGDSSHFIQVRLLFNNIGKSIP